MQLRCAAIRATVAIGLCALASSAVLAARAATALGGACGLISTTAVATDFDLAKAAIKPVLTLPPKFGGVESTCVLNAWSGKNPAIAKHDAAKLARGKLALLAITTWEPESELLLTGGSAEPFTETLGEFTETARKRFVVGLGGKTFKAPSLGAEAAGYKAAHGHKREAEVLWWSPGNHHILTLEIVEGRTTPILAPLRKLAATVVPAFAL